MTLHHCLYPDWGTAEDYFRKKKMDEPGHGLAFINSQYTRSPYYKDDGKFWSPEFGDHQFWIYNCMDAMVTFESAMKMMQEAQDENLWDFYQTQYIRPFYSAVRAEWFGTGVDAEGKETAKAAFRERAEELQRDINGIVGFPMNVNSPKVIAEFLYKTRRYQVKLKHGTGKPTADKDTLRYFAEKHSDPVLLKILELRHTLDVISDFLEQPLDANGNIHTHYRIGGTDGLRWASSKSILGNVVNFQNLPREGITRRLFVAR
jgi:DNA polymerase I-like protein with 3'-5' exonuclease and polymerase domains